MKELNIALLGLGTVGSGVVKIMKRIDNRLKTPSIRILSLNIF